MMAYQMIQNDLGTKLQRHCEQTLGRYITMATDIISKRHISNDSHLCNTDPGMLLIDNICCIIGRCYYDGIGTIKDKEKALEWWHKGAETFTTTTTAEEDNMTMRSSKCNGWCALAIGFVLEDIPLRIKWLTKSMESGNTLAAQQLANIYKEGIVGGLEKDEKKALELLKWSAEQSLLPSHQWISYAPFLLALWYYLGRCTSKCYGEALKWLTIASNQPNSIGESECYIGWIYENGGYGIEKDAKLAFQWMLRSAEQNYDKGLFGIGRYYRDGIGTSIDYLAAIEWWKKASRHHESNGDADTNIGLAYTMGNGVEKDEKEAAKWYLKGAHRGHAIAQYNLSICYRHGRNGIEKDERLAFEWMLRSAQQNNASAVTEIGNYYRDGIGTPIDYLKAFEWESLTRSRPHERNGNADNLIGCAYEYVVKDDKEAMKWYLKGAQRGSPAAQYNSAVCYRNGKGIDKNEVKSFEWMLRSAQQNYAIAFYSIAMFYENGIGTSSNYPKYVEWIKKALQHPLADHIAKPLACLQCSCSLPKPIEDTSELITSLIVGELSAPTMPIEWWNEMRALHFEFGGRLGRRSQYYYGERYIHPQYDGSNAAVYVARIRRPLSDMKIGRHNNGVSGGSDRNTFEEYPLVAKCIFNYDGQAQTTRTLMVNLCQLRQLSVG
jgi:TPR repeat protein